MCKGLVRVAEDKVRNTGRKVLIPFFQRIFHGLPKLVLFVGCMFHRFLKKLFDKLLDESRWTLVLNVKVFFDLMALRA